MTERMVRKTTGRITSKVNWESHVIPLIAGPLEAIHEIKVMIQIRSVDILYNGWGF